MHLLLTPILAFALCTLLHLGALHVFPKIGLLDFPERYGLHRPRIPYPTGILAILSFLLFFLSLHPIINYQNAGIILGIILLGIVSFIDDRTPLPPLFRFSIQITVAIIIFATGSRIYTITNPLESLIGIPYLKLDSINIPSQFSILNSSFGHGLRTGWQFSIPFGPLPLISGLFTILWLGLAMNALNWFDGIPGQVSSLSTVGFTVIGLLALSSRVHQPAVALMSFTLAGIAAACLIFDFPFPHFQFSIFNFQFPRVLMGDTGAMFFGLMLGILTIYAGGKVATAFLAFGVPFTDCIIVIARRIISRHSPFRGSTTGEHLHHRLLARGWSERHVIILNVILGSVFGIGALFLSTIGKFLAALLLGSILFSLAWYARPAKATN